MELSGTTWQLERRGSHEQIAVLTFVRPPRNLMNSVSMGQLELLLEEIADDRSINVVVMTGGVDGYFVGHADIDDLARLGRGEPVEGDIGSWARAFAKLASMPQPVIAAINGQAWGGGMEIALAATMRVAAASAHLAQVEVNLGIIPGAGGTQHLPRLVGPGRAAELILSGRVVHAEEALAIGLVEAILSDDGFVERVLEWVAPIAAKPHHALAAAKLAILAGRDRSLADGLRLEGRLFVQCQARPDVVAREMAVLDQYRQASPDDHVKF